MAFNGTEHFAKNDLVKYLQSIGVRFGADLNAYTSFDNTTGKNTSTTFGVITGARTPRQIQLSLKLYF